jgi:tetratricopeptide (TPR) repeat protein
LPPQDARHSLFLGRIDGELGRFQEALPYLRRVTELKPENARGWQLLARCLQRLEDYSRSLRPPQQAVCLAPQEPACRYALAAALYMTGQVDAAEPEYRTALRMAPNHVEAHYDLGHLYWQARRDWRRGEAEFQRALEIDPGHVSAVNALAVLYYQTGRRAQALDLMENALRRYPGHPGLQENLHKMRRG